MPDAAATALAAAGPVQSMVAYVAGGLAVIAVACFALQLLCGFNAVGTNAKVHPKNTDDSKIWREDFGRSVLADKAKKVDKDGKPLKKYPMAEIARHCEKDDAWIVVDELVYDVTEFIPRHPGGRGPMLNLLGKDCTDVFANYHAQRVYKYQLPRYLIGQVSDLPAVPAHVQDFRAVRQELLQRGLFETDYRFYYRLGSWLAALFCGAVHLSLQLGFRERMAGACLMGLFWQQLAGLGHDLGHSGVTHDFHLDHKIGSTLTALMGLSTCWWKSDHNTHHVVCNAVEHDPNINYMPMLAVTEKSFETPYFESYHKKWITMNAFARMLVSYQHLFFYPIMLVARINLYVQGLIFLAASPDTMHYQKTELASLSAFACWMGALIYAQGSWQNGLAWFMVGNCAAGVLHVQIVLSHWAMHFYKGRAYNDDSDEWYITQLRTTMNVDTPEPLDYLHIGLQFQIEHHLYPRLPRHNLREARKLVQAVCKKHKLDYHEPGFLEGNYEMFMGLYNTALEARKAPKQASGFYHSAIWEGMNLNG